MCGLPEGTSPEWAAGFNAAMRTIAFWLDFQAGVRRRSPLGRMPLREVDMRKSALLGRLVRGEEVRRRPCPRHQGVMWCSFGFDALRCVCEGTGWLANDHEVPTPPAEE